MKSPNRFCPDVLFKMRFNKTNESKKGPIRKVEKPDMSDSEYFDWCLRPLKQNHLIKKKKQKKFESLNNSDLPNIRQKLKNMKFTKEKGRNSKAEARMKKLQALKAKQILKQNSHSYRFFRKLDKKNQSAERDSSLKFLKPGVKKYKKYQSFMSQEKRLRTEPPPIHSRRRYHKKGLNMKEKRKIFNPSSQSSGKINEALSMNVSPLISIRKMSLPKQKKKFEVSLPLKPVIKKKKKIGNFNHSPEAEKFREKILKEKMKFTQTRGFYNQKYKNSGRKMNNRNLFWKRKKSNSRKRKPRNPIIIENIKEELESKNSKNIHEKDNSASERGSFFGDLDFESTSFYHLKSRYGMNNSHHFDLQNFSYLSKMVDRTDHSLDKTKKETFLESWGEIE